MAQAKAKSRKVKPARFQWFVSNFIIRDPAKLKDRQAQIERFYERLFKKANAQDVVDPPRTLKMSWKKFTGSPSVYQLTGILSSKIKRKVGTVGLFGKDPNSPGGPPPP